MNYNHLIKGNHKKKTPDLSSGFVTFAIPRFCTAWLGTRSLLCSGVLHYQQVREHSHIGIFPQVCTDKAADIQCCDAIQLRSYDDN